MNDNLDQIIFAEIYSYPEEADLIIYVNQETFNNLLNSNSLEIAVRHSLNNFPYMFNGDYPLAVVDMEDSFKIEEV